MSRPNPTPDRMTPSPHSRFPVGHDVFGLRVWGGTVETVHEPHRHNEIEINAIESGYFTYLLAGREVTVGAGEIALFWGAIPHQVIRLQPGTRLHWATVPLDRALHWELPAAFVRGLLEGGFYCTADAPYGQAFFAHWSADLAVGRETLVLMELRALCFRLAQTRQADPVHAEGETGGPAARMALYMSRHFDQPLTVADIAAQVGLHPNYAMTVFRQAFGTSLIDYLTQQRIAHAQQLLITTSASVTTIALDSGFATLSHFYTAFNRLCGMPPGRYRAALRG